MPSWEHSKEKRQGLQKGFSDPQRLVLRVGAQRIKVRASGPLPKAGKIEEERWDPEGQSEVRAEAEASRNSRGLETSPGAWPRELVLDTEVSQGTSSGHCSYTDTPQSVQEAPTAVLTSGAQF